MDDAEPAVAAVHPDPIPDAAPAVAAVVPEPPARAPRAPAQQAAAVAREVYQTSKKKEAVVVDGYVMIKHHVSVNALVQYWRCECVNSSKCNARGTSPVDSTAVVMREKYKDHNHEANVTALKVRSYTPTSLDKK